MGQAEQWAIAYGDDDIFYGTYHTRNDAIASHVRALYDLGLPSFCFGGLSKRQKSLWAMCKRSGDKAVRVTVSWDYNG